MENIIKTHEVQLSASEFNQFANNDYIILKANDISKNDYILFKQVETVEGKIVETSLYRMTQVREVITNVGLKDGYVLLVINKL